MKPWAGLVGTSMSPLLFQANRPPTLSFQEQTSETSVWSSSQWPRGASAVVLTNPQDVPAGVQVCRENHTPFPRRHSPGRAEASPLRPREAPACSAQLLLRYQPLAFLSVHGCLGLNATSPTEGTGASMSLRAQLEVQADELEGDLLVRWVGRWAGG